MKTLTLFLSILLLGCTKPAGKPVIRLANVGTAFQVGTIPLYLAQTLGYFEQEGVEIELQNFSASAKALQALVGGSADVASMLYFQTIQVAAEGQSVQSFFVASHLGGNVIMVTPSAAGRIREAKDLKGATIGVGAIGSTTQFFATSILRKHGISPSDVQWTPIGIGPSAIAAVESGRIDIASVAGGDHFHILRRHPGLRILSDISTPEGARDLFGESPAAFYAMVARPEWLRTNAETARRFTRALRRGLHWTAAHSAEEIRAQLPAEFRTSDAEIDHKIIRWGKPFLTADGAMPRGAPETMKRFLDPILENVRTAKIDLRATWTDEYLDNPK